MAKKSEIVFESAPETENATDALPSSVNILGLEYRVVYRKMDGVFGHVMYADQLIEINSTHPVARQKRTLIHEIAHALLYESGFGNHSEQVVERVEMLLFQFAASNSLDWLKL